MQKKEKSICTSERRRKTGVIVKGTVTFFWAGGHNCFWISREKREQVA